MTLPHYILSELSAVVGAAHVIVDAVDQSPYILEPRKLWKSPAAAVIRPANTEEVAAIVKIAAAHGIAVIPQGGNTGLVGGQVPVSGDEIILSLLRLDRVREVDTSTNTMTLEAGVTLQRAQEIAEERDRLFPLSLASEGSCTIGGNLATNAGGSGVLAYGSARDLTLGIEAVLADGRVLRDLRKLRKDNTGYDLTRLLIGSEGTLGIITAATLKLFPRPRAYATAFVGLASVEAAIALLRRMQAEAFGTLTAFELMPRLAIDLQLRHMSGTADPLASRHEWYVLLEMAAQDQTMLDEALSLGIYRAIEDNVVADAALANSLEQRAALWQLRERISWVQGQEGGSIKHDVSVPIAAVPDFIAEADAAVTARIPDSRPMPFGHLGDGNIHYNVMQPTGMDRAAFLARWGEINHMVHGIVTRYGGSIAAEHGVGQLKRDALAAVKDPVALSVMRAVKNALDPNGILNPEKVLSPSRPHSANCDPART